MIKVICDTKKEKEDVDKLLRLGKLTVMVVEIILKMEVPCFNHVKVKWKIKEDT